MAFKFPFTNYHELNLTWVLEQLKKLFEDSKENVETIEGYENRLSAVEDELPVVEATADQAAQTANAAATLAQTAKATADTANENALAASAQAGLARQEAAAAEAEAQAATQAAQQAQATAQNFDGRITQAEADASEALQEAQSFENRVNAAINTANNAANTATIAQGIAVNANQNAATALDTAQTADGKAEVADGKAEAAQDTANTNAANIGNLSDLTTTAKSNLVSAINEAAQTGGGTDNTKAPLIVSDASGEIASFSDGANDMQIQELICTIEPVQAGTGDPSPTNVRPISGHTGAEVTRTGKNLFGGDAFYYAWLKAGISGSSGEDEIGRYVTIPTNSSITDKILFDKFKPNTVYTIICKYKKSNTNANTNMLIRYTNNGVMYVSRPNDVVADELTTISVVTSGLSIKMLGTIWASGTATIYYDYFGIFEGVLTADDFEPYTGTTIPITFPTTIYGGSDEVIGGALESTFGMFDMGALNWYYVSSRGIMEASPAGVKPFPNTVVSSCFCSQYKTVSYGSIYNNDQDKSIGIAMNGRIYVYDSTYTDAATFKAAMTGVQLCYELAEPVEYTLTPHELTTLYGVNNVWTDVGAIQSCKYPADTKLYIDGKVAELQALILEN